MVTDKPRYRVKARNTDSLVNFTSKLGVSGDKQFDSTYFLWNFSQTELDNAYRSSWLARKIVDIPPYDMTREWRNWQAEDDQIQAIEDEEDRLGFVKAVRRAMTWGRLYGGAAIILGVDQGLPQEPLEIDRIKQDDLKFLHVVTRYQLNARQIDFDPMSETFMRPVMYQMGGGSRVIDLHPSRVIPFIGVDMTPVQIFDVWGDPLWMSLRDSVVNSDTVSAALASLVHEAKVDVISIPGLLTSIIGDDAAEAQLLKRFALANQTKSVNNMLLIDAGNGDGKSGEVWNRKEYNFTGLPDLLRLFLAVASGAADIPATRLLGKSPDGMNSTGENDLRNYYDMISARQKTDMWPNITTLDEVLMQSLFGAIPDEIYFESAPLWQMTPAEKATIGKQKADTTAIYAASGLLPDDALSEAVQNQLVEDMIYPGLEAAIASSTMTPTALEPPALPGAGETLGLRAPPGTTSGRTAGPGTAAQPIASGTKTGDQRARKRPRRMFWKKPVKARDAARKVYRMMPLRDAAPRTLYVRRDVKNADAIRSWAKDQGFTTALPASEMHVTIMYSRTPVDWMKINDEGWGNNKDGGISVSPGGPRMIDKFGDAIVLLFNSNALTWRHQDMKRIGASYDYAEYQPHITITYQAPPNLDLMKIDPYQGPIELGPEIFEEIDDNFNGEALVEDRRPFDDWNPDQPRVPAGSPGGGEFGSGSGSSSGGEAGGTSKAGERDNVLRDYQDSADINNVLRQNGNLSPESKKKIEVLDKAIKEQRLAETSTFYRGVDPKIASTIDSLKTGQMIRQDGYTSVTSDLSVADNFTQEGAGRIIEVVGYKGTPALKINVDKLYPHLEEEIRRASDMSEVILPRGIGLQYTGKSNEGRKVFKAIYRE